MDNISQSTGNLSSGNSLTSGGSMAIGGEQDAVDGGYTVGQAFHGDIAEVIFYEGKLTHAQITVVSNYLNLKYGDTNLGLATDHFDNTNAGNAFMPI